MRQRVATQCSSFSFFFSFPLNMICVDVVCMCSKYSAVGARLLMTISLVANPHSLRSSKRTQKQEWCVCMCLSCNWHYLFFSCFPVKQLFFVPSPKRKGIKNKISGGWRKVKVKGRVKQLSWRIFWRMRNKKNKKRIEGEKKKSKEKLVGTTLVRITGTA